MSQPNERNVSFQTILDALLDETTPFPAQYLYRFSDISARDLRELMSVWGQVAITRRRRLLEDLEQLAEGDTLLSFHDFSKAILQDLDAQIRMYGIRLLWEDEDKTLVPSFIQMMETDEDADVRATAANALGYFVYQGEVEEIPEDLLHTIEESLLNVSASDQPVIIRRRALESLGFSSRAEVPALIERAYSAETPDWVASSLYAMGRSADRRWKRQVIEKLDHPVGSVRVEAVRAAGELELSQTRSQLLEIAQQDEDDDVRLAAIWSLSQIGGAEVRDVLERMLDETEDDEEADFIEDALENLSFTDDMQILDMFDFGMDEEEEEDEEDHPDGGKTNEQPTSRNSKKKRGPEG